MEAAIDRIMQTYDLLVNRTAAANAEARTKVTEYLTTLVEAGEKDPHRLTVCGLTYLRQLDGSSDPVKAGSTGLKPTVALAAFLTMQVPRAMLTSGGRLIARFVGIRRHAPHALRHLHAPSRLLQHGGRRLCR